MGLIITSRVLKALRQSQGANFYLEWEPLTNPLRCQFSSLFSFNFICLFLAVLGLRCCLQAFSSYRGGVGYSCSCEQLFIAAASLVAENGLKAPGASGVVVHELSCPTHVGSSQTRDRTHVPCISSQILPLDHSKSLFFKSPVAGYITTSLLKRKWGKILNTSQGGI